MKHVDSSILVAGFASWHEFHKVAQATLDDETRVSAHALLETYSVLTRLPPPHRVDPSVAFDFLKQWFHECKQLDAEGHMDFFAQLPRRRIAGGSVYDALIAWTAVAQNATLVTCDRRALDTYEKCDASIELVG